MKSLNILEGASLLSSAPHGGSTRAATRRALLAGGAAATAAVGGGIVNATAAHAASASTAGTAGTASTATPDWFSVAAYGADPTGVVDSTTAFTSAITAAAAAAGASDSTTTGGAVVYVPAGVYTVSKTLTCTAVPVYFVGDGAWASIISYVGTGDCLRIYDSTAYNSRKKASGGVIGITIDGTHATGTSCGLHVGDLLRYELDLTVQNFTGSGSIGIHLDNNYFWTEQLTGRIYAQGCTSNIVFDWTSATSSTSSGSFERCDLDVYIDGYAYDGVVFQNGAFITNGSLRIRGNFGCAASPVTSAVLRLTGSGNANNYSGDSGITNSLLDIGVECAPATKDLPYTPQTIVFGTGAGNKISNCYGALHFGAAGNNFAQSNNKGNIYGFIGHTSGDATLPGRWTTYTSGFPAGITGQVSFRLLPTGNEVMVAWNLTLAPGHTLPVDETVLTVSTEFAYAADNKIIPGNIAGGSLSANAYAPVYLTPAGVFKYIGPSIASSSGNAWWYGQGVYTLDLG